jgi:calcium uniporter protein, mitochondrial
MRYAPRAFSSLVAATNIRRLTGCRESGRLYQCAWRRLPGPGSNARLFTSLPSRARDYIKEESADETNRRDQRAHEKQVKASLQEATKQQIRRPWQREGADQPPAEEAHRRMNKNMTKGSPTLS